MTDHAPNRPRHAALAACPEAPERSFQIGLIALTCALALLPAFALAGDDTSKDAEAAEIETEAAEEAAEDEREPAEIVDESSPDLKTPEEVEGELAPDDTVEEGLDVDDVTEEAEVPEEDANPNPVVPQGGVIPPASIKDEADQ
ncbi:hypothetical protein [Roseovarius aquimarinus]|uniref:Uncharacterized protein n=1 Tax=Roseovarius aquimarinus TaxID=1229156 RepID=A0ABW7I9H6_9RHOB